MSKGFQLLSKVAMGNELTPAERRELSTFELLTYAGYGRELSADDQKRLSRLEQEIYERIRQARRPR